MKPNVTKIIVTDATTGKNIDVINFDLYDIKFIGEMIVKIFEKYYEDGILIKCGIEPY